MLPSYIMPDISQETLLSNLLRENIHLPLVVLKEIDSTNSYAINLIKNSGFESGLIVAETQTNGRGTKGRSFSSPAGGAYFTIVFPLEGSDYINALTPLTAVAASHAFESICDNKISIKWVNDIIIKDRKACGILTETVVSPQSGRRIAVIGIGANIYSTDESMPAELQNEISWACDEYTDGIIENFIAICTAFVIKNIGNFTSENLYFEYKKRLGVLKRPLLVIKSDSVKKAEALDINRDYTLLVQYEDGTQESISCDEVSLKL